MEGNRVSKDKWRRIGLVKVSKEMEKGRKRKDRRGRKKGRRQSVMGATQFPVPSDVGLSSRMFFCRALIS